MEINFDNEYKYCANEHVSNRVYKLMQDFYTDGNELIADEPDDISEPDSLENDINPDEDIMDLFEEYLVRNCQEIN